MSSSDNYEYEKSNQSQNIDSYSPYVEKQQSSLVNDLNNSVYANSSLSLVQFDLKNDWGEKLHAIVNRLLQWKNVKTPINSL